MKTTEETFQREIANRSADKGPKIMHVGHRWDLQPLRTESDAIHGPKCLSKIPLGDHRNQPVQVLLGILNPFVCYMSDTKKSDPALGLKSRSAWEGRTQSSKKPLLSMAHSAEPRGCQAAV